MHLLFCRLGTVGTPPQPRPGMALGSHSPSEVDADDVELNVGFNPFRPAAALLLASGSNGAAADSMHPGPNPFQRAALHALGSSDGAAALKAGVPQALRRQQSRSFKLARGSPEAASRPGAEPGTAQSGSLLPSSLPCQSMIRQSISFKPGTGSPGPDGPPGGAAGRAAADLGMAEQGPQSTTAGLRWRQSLSKLGAGSPEVGRPLPEVAGPAELGPLLSAGGPRRSAMKGARGKAASELAGRARLQPAGAPQVVAGASAQPAAPQGPLCVCTGSVCNRCLDAVSSLPHRSMAAQGLNELELSSQLRCDTSQPNHAQPTGIPSALWIQLTPTLLCRPYRGAWGSQQRQSQVESCRGSCSGGPQVFRCDVVPVVP